MEYDQETAKADRADGLRPKQISLESASEYFVMFRAASASRKAKPALYVNARDRETLLQYAHEQASEVHDLGIHFVQSPLLTTDHNLMILDGSLLIEETAPPGLANNFAESAGLMQPGILEKKSTRSITRPALIIGGPGYTVWGHWLLDFLPRLFIAKEILASELGEYIIPVPGNIPRWAFDAVEFFANVDRGQFELYDPGMEKIRCEEGACIPTYAHRNYFIHPFMIESYQRLRHNNTNGPQRICVSRRHLTSSGGYPRDFPNRPYLEQSAVKHGFNLVHPEQLGFQAQIDMFFSAKVVAGEYGSGMHNTIFSSEGTIVGQFMQTNSIQSRIAGARGHTSIYLMPDVDPNFTSGGAPVTLNVSEAAIDAFFECVNDIETQSGDER